ncbi:MAG: respiratory-chain dehydrogenase subunit 1 [Firmicutes bacterium]|nr:respiratory-chain dehydrogenase subunit 1 [Bacillota bacterium]
MTMFIDAIQALILLMAAPLVVGVIKKAKARLQNRRGPVLRQLYYDILKLLAKDSVESPTVSWIFRITPYIYFTAALAAAAFLPIWLYGGGFANDLLVFIYLLAAGRFFLVLSSLDAGSAFGGMGGSREMFISVLVEPVLLLAMLTVAVRSGSTNLFAMAGTAMQETFSLSYFFAAGAFFIVMLAESGRIPVDNPDTHLELTMIHEGMVLEYSGRPLGLIFWAAALKQLILILLFVLLFVPWPSFGAGSLLLQGISIVVKVVLVAVSLAVAETVTNKMRLFKVPNFMALSGLLSLLALAAQ